MRFREFGFILKESIQSDAVLLTVLNHLQKKAKESQSDGKFNMDSVINHIRNAGADTFEYDNFVDAFENNQAVKNMVSNFNREFISLRVDSSGGTGELEPERQEELVSKMAQSAV
jgi:hypothetical protein